MAKDSKKSKARYRAKLTRKETILIQNIWPDFDPTKLWRWGEDRPGYTHIPRTMPYISLVMDHLSQESKISNTYWALWCQKIDNLIINKNLNLLAFEAGFKGQRALPTVISKINELIRLEFIETRAGSSGDFEYIAIWNPYIVIKNHYLNNKIEDASLYNSLIQKAVDIGATDVE